MEALVLKLLARFFPVPVTAIPVTQSEVERSEADKLMFAQMSKTSTLIYIPSMLISIAAWYFGLSALSDYVAAAYYHVDVGDTMFKQEFVYWGLPALLMGTITPAIPLAWYQRSKFTPAQMKGYAQFESERQGADVEKLETPLLWTVTIICTIFIVLGLNHYFVLKDDRIVVSGYLNPTTRVYPFSSIDIMTTTLHKSNEGNSRSYVIYFSSGEVYNTSNLPMGARHWTTTEMMELLSERSGKPIKDLGTK